MGNPNLVRKISNSPSGTSGEVSPAGLVDLSQQSRNIIINGNFDIWQRNTTQGAGLVGDLAYKSVDRFRPGGNPLATGLATLSRNTDVPSLALSGAVS